MANTEDIKLGSRRKILKTLSYCLLFLIFPIKTIYASTKKIINQNLSIQQKDIIVVPRGLSRGEIIENINLSDFILSDEQMDMILKLRKRNLRLVDPEVRRPVWDLP